MHIETVNQQKGKSTHKLQTIQWLANILKLPRVKKTHIKVWTLKATEQNIIAKTTTQKHRQPKP